MTQLDIVYIKFCADALCQDRKNFLEKVQNVFEIERSASAFRELISLGVPCVDLESSKRSTFVRYKSKNAILQWIREIAMSYISRSEELQKQFIKESIKAE